ncbi:FAD-dependent oxidoreductase [Lysobacter enzymogenes]|uniref:FAD-dependent oxidoreductase n=1 Tax=Lysobacter enzymogenes TaxID=69 RepID=UPI001A956C2A|nr:FAD-dependent oxidoreductase [Lysobacter enzymogenes]QQP94295.1 FAD-dependent oxidoreductase [Lysobacter enzymogenes]
MTERCDVLVVGAGPAGLAAARAAASHGADVVLIDMQASAGGQVWRRDVRRPWPDPARDRLDHLLDGERVRWLGQTQVVAAGRGCVLVEQAGVAYELAYGALVLATGARELLLPFAGWTLPGVTGAGGLQALVKQGWPIAGKRVLIAGSGPLLLAAADTARRHGARVVAICEQTPAPQLRAFATKLWRWPGKLAQAAALRARLAAVAYRADTWVAAAHGDGRVTEVELHGARGVERVAVDQLAVGYGLVPNLELAQRLGCELQAHGAHACVRVDAAMRTSVADVYAAGEACGIGGRDCALIEGEMAGHAAAGAPEAALALQTRRRRARAFAGLLPEHFALREQIAAAASADSVVCRCEDVRLGELDAYTDWRAAKLATRCGMGSCQGRICGAALAQLRGPRFAPAVSESTQAAARARPPLFPVRLAALAATHAHDEPLLPAAPSPAPITHSAPQGTVP